MSRSILAYVSTVFVNGLEKVSLRKLRNQNSRNSTNKSKFRPPRPRKRSPGLDILGGRSWEVPILKHARNNYPSREH